MEPTAENPLKVLSLGAGVQSTALLLMAFDPDIPEIPEFDVAIFSDTGWEPESVYRQVWLLAEFMQRQGKPLYLVSNGDIRAESVAGTQFGMPVFVKNKEGKKGQLQRTCTHQYKIKPVEQQIRRLLGLKPRQRAPKERVIEHWFGISLDEVQRMRESTFHYMTYKYPLVDARLKRHDCVLYLERNGWLAAKSACIGCPFRSDSGWRSLTPDQFQDAVDFDHAIRDKARMDDPVFLHTSLQPLDEVDLSTPEDHGQQAMFTTDCGVCHI